MPIHASPPACLDVSRPSECRLGPRFGYNLEIDQSIGPTCRDPDVRNWALFGSGGPHAVRLHWGLDRKSTCMRSSDANDPGCVKTREIETPRELHSSVRFQS